MHTTNWVVFGVPVTRKGISPEGLADPAVKKHAAMRSSPKV